jgi:hypothetical protein
MLWFLCCGKEKSASSGVAILIDQKRNNKIERYIYVNDRILTTRLQTEKKHAKFTSSRNAILKFCKGIYMSG